MRAYLVQSAAGCSSLAERVDKAKVLGFDTESHGPNLESGKMLNVFRSALTGFSLAFDNGEAFYIPVAHQKGNAPFHAARTLLERILDSECYAFNLKHELHALHSLSPKPLARAKDAMIMAWLLEMPGVAKGRASYGLKALTPEHLGETMDSFETVSKGRGWNEVDPADGFKYACADALYTLRLGEKFDPLLAEYGLEDVFYEQEMPLVRVLADMEWRGMYVDTARLEALADRVQARVKEIQAEWRFMFPGVSISSTKQVREHFYGNKLWPQVGADTTPTGLLSVNRANMELALSHARTPTDGRVGAELRCEFQDCAKILSTYTHSLVAKAEQHLDGRIHPSFLQTGTRTGRLSCADPNLMQIPVRTPLGLEVKDAFRAPEGSKLVSADYSQLELRVIAHLSKEGRLLEGFLKSGDFFDNMANEMGKPRNHVKTAMYAYVYGAGASKIGRTLGIGRSGGYELIKALESTYPELPALKNKAKGFAQKTGLVRTPTRRLRRLENIHSTDGSLRSRDERRSFNTVVQGFAADVVKRAMIASFKYGLHQIAQVHDEIACEESLDVAKERAYLLQEAMENAWPGFRVPLLAEPVVVDSWKDTK